MKRVKEICRWLLALCVVVATGCVDDSFRIDEVSTEVTIGQGTTTIPLGSVGRKTLGDLLAEAEGIDTLLTNRDGRYVIGIDDDGSYTIDGIEHIVNIPAISGEFRVDYPEFALTGHAHQIDDYVDVTTDYGALSLLVGHSVPVPDGLTITGEKEGALVETFGYDVPDMISGIQRVYLKPAAAGDPGARVDVRFMLNDLAQINGGGHVNLELKAPAGCNIYDGNGVHVEDGEFVVSEFDFSAGTDELPFLIYVESVANEEPIKDGRMELSVDLEYHISFEMVTKASNITLSEGPQLHISSNLAYADADIILNEVAILDHMSPNGGDVTIKNLPQELTSIRSLTFAEESPLVLVAGGFEWMAEELAEKIIIDAWLPDYLILHDNVEIGYDAKEHRLHTTLSCLRNGIEVDLDALDFGDEGLAPHNGNIAISFAPNIDARIAPGTEIKLSSIMHEGEMRLSAGIKEATLDIQEVCGGVDYGYTYAKRFDIHDIGELSIDGVGLNPVLKLELENPFTIELMASYEIAPYIDGQMVADRAISTNGYGGVGYITIPAASVEGGVVVPAKSTIVLATEASRDEHDAPGTIFVPCDIDRLLSGKFPDQLDVRLDVQIDSSKEVSLHASDSYVLNYSYLLEMPIEIDNKTSLGYTQSVDFNNASGGNPFASLAELDYIKVGDVAVIADVITTLPLQFAVSVDLLDVEGEVIEGLIVMPEGSNSIVGSEDGVTPVQDRLRLELHLADDGNIAQLGDVCGINLRLQAGGVAERGVALSDEQYVEVSLKLELSGGLTADLKELESL